MGRRFNELLVWFVGALALVISSSTSTRAQDNNSVLPSAGFPQSIGSVAFDLPQKEGRFEQFTSCGIKIWRNDFRWAFFEKEKGKYDFSEYDRDLKRIDNAGMTALFVLWGSNQLYPGFPQATGEATSTPPEQFVPFARFAAAAAEHFRGKRVIFELDNEPDGNGGPTPQQYVDWAKATVAAMRHVDAHIVIAGPAAHHYALQWIEQVFRLGLLDSLDIVTVHLYNGGKPEDGWRQPEDNASRVAAVRALIDKYDNGRHVPMACSEWGFNRLIPGSTHRSFAISTEDQASWAVRGMLLSVMWDLRFNVWFCYWLPQESIRDSSDWGLVTAAWQPMPAYFAIRTLYEQLPDAKFRKRVDVGAPNDYVLAFDTAKGVCWTIWTCGDHHTINVPVGNISAVNLTDLSGTRSYTLPVTDGQLKLDASGSVLYVKPVKR